MSRIQNILDKAERDGAVRRVRTMAEAAAGASGAASAAVLSTAVVSPAYPDPSFAEALPADAGGGAAFRVVSGAPLDARLIAGRPSRSTTVTAEQYRALRTRILNANHGSTVRVILVTSPGRSDGKSLTTANLGLSMAQEPQRRTCLVDADLRHPRLHRLFGVPQEPGLADVLAGRATLQEALVVLDEHQITLLPAGAGVNHPAELLGTTAMRRTIDTLRSEFDRVLMDSPAVSPLADVGILTPLVDAVVLVVRAGVTSKPAVHEALAAIDASKLIGAVLNDAA